MRKRFICIFLLVLGWISFAAGRLPEKGVPAIESFVPDQFFNFGKIWDIGSSPSGMVYMAADKGLLEFDGSTWIPFTGSKGFTRSLMVVNDSLIFSGSDLDFGVWKKNKFQFFEYTSLYPFREELIEVGEEFWDVHPLGENVVFVSFQNLYICKDQQTIKISAPYRFSGSFQAGEMLYFADEREGLFVLDGLSLSQVFRYPGIGSFEISGIFSFDPGLLVVTKDQGLFFFDDNGLRPVNHPLSETLKSAKVFCTERISENYLAFGTVLKGLFITDQEGRIIHQINKHKGLPNNTILSLYHSPSGKLWLGMDYGVSAINLNQNLTYFFDFTGDFGTGHTALVKDDVFFLGTNQGLYRSDWLDLNNNAEVFSFRLVPGSEGQVWSLENLNNTLFVGHDLGLFELENNKLKKIGDEHGVWTIILYKEFLLTGNYNGISIYKRSGESWSFLKKMDLILGSCNQLVIEKENILWVNIPNFGIIRAVLDDNLFPRERLIFPESLFSGKNPLLVKEQDGIKVVTDEAYYSFLSQGEEFLSQPDNFYRPSVKGLLPDFFQPLAIKPDYAFYPVYNGFAFQYLPGKINGSEKINNLILRKIEGFNNKERVLFFVSASIPYRFNNLEIVCIVPNQEGVQYQYKFLDEDHWTPWQAEGSFELLGLKAGEYFLEVRARVNDQLSTPLIIPFSIGSPWYWSWYAFAAYLLILASLVFSLITWQRISLKKQKKTLLQKQQASLRQQAEKYRNEIMLLEQERLLAENEQMKQQLKNKTIELASKARDDEEKNRLLLSLKEKCESAQENQSLSRMRWAEIQRLLDSYLNVEDKTFEIQMDELHQEFFRKLKERFPTLSNNDLRLCAYLKIGLNSKEIADILNILPSSAFISRSRLRKKLNLKADEDLHDYLNSI